MNRLLTSIVQIALILSVIYTIRLAKKEIKK